MHCLELALPMKWRKFMRSKQTSMFRALLALFLLAFTYSANAQVYDLAADWSDTNNPNGGWQYGLLTPSMVFTPFTSHTANYIGGGDFPTNNQPAWISDFPSGLAKSTGVSSHDFPIGRVGGHTPRGLQGTDYLATQWTAPDNGQIDISGDVWMWRDIGRLDRVSVFINGIAEFSDVTIPTRSQGYTSANPFTFTQAIVSGGGSGSNLLHISVHKGDTVDLGVRFLTEEDFVGMDETIKFSPITTSVPEPNTALVVLSGGLMGTIMLLRLRRNMRALPQ